MLTEQTLGLEVDAFLEHFGAKGMKWGVRKSSAERSAGRAMNKASRRKDTDKMDKTIDRARGRTSSGKTKADWKKAKGEHSANKTKLGSREARKILNKAREKKYKDINNAQAAKSGKETAIVLGIIGVVGALHVASIVANKG